MPGTIRDRVRAIRLFYKSMRLFKSAFSNYRRAWLLPFSGGGRFQLLSREGFVDIPAAFWTMLPTASRLTLSGARPFWREQKLYVELGSHCFSSPPMDKSIGGTLKEIFIDDVYRLGHQDLTGATVLDVGAHIGDSSVAFAARGAMVHAFEPLPMLLSYLQENISLNKLDGKIIIHPVGLSCRDETIHASVNPCGSAGATVFGSERAPKGRSNFIFQDLKLVNAIDYLKSQSIGNVDILKLDCEGCEYSLFANSDLLDYLKPGKIILEYHRGGQVIADFFEANGYAVEWPEPTWEVGYMFAQRIKS